MQLMGGCTVRGVMTSMDPLWIIMECLQMTHHPLTSLAISFPLLSLFRMHLTRLVVNTHRVALTSLNFMSNCAVLSARNSHIQLMLNVHCNALFHSSPARVFVHCAVGVSRSASLVLAYLMIHHHYTLLDAISKVKERRWIFPNTGFLKQLRALDIKLHKTP